MTTTPTQPTKSIPSSTVRTSGRHPGWGPLWQDLLTSEHYERLRNGCFWFLCALVARVNHRTGRLVTTWTQLALETGLTEQHLRSMAGHLRRKGYASVVSQGADTVLFTVQGWRPIALRAASPRRSTVGPGDERRPPPEPPIPPLAREVATALGVSDEDDLDVVVELVEAHPEQLIRRTLEEARRVPSDKIRKSRFALWRFLVQQHAQKHDREEET